MDNALTALSHDLAAAVERASSLAVTVHGRPRVASSGLLWRDNLVVTAEHTVRRDEDLYVSAADGEKRKAELAGRDPGSDLALLRVPGLTAPSSTAATSPRVGELALAIGRSSENGTLATLGVISTVAGPWRTWRGGHVEQLLRLDVSLYPGASGGPVIDAQGRILGIATAGLSRSATVAIPMATIERVAGELAAQGHVKRGYLGIGLQPVALPDHLRKALGGDQAVGVILLSVEPDSPAAKAGLLLGDTIVELEGKPVADPDDIQAALRPANVGKSIDGRLIRGGAIQPFSVTIANKARG